MIKLSTSALEIASLRADAEHAARYFETATPIPVSKENWGIDGSTFRAFTGYPDRPSVHYRKWAAVESGKLIASDSLSKIGLQATHVLLTSSIEAHWRTLGAIDLHKVLKLVDLFLLRMAKFEALKKSQRDLIRLEGNPALDKHTFAGLARIVPGLVVGLPDMRAIQSREQYDALQMVIRQITKLAQVPNLNFDFWCWPTNRRRAAKARGNVLNG